MPFQISILGFASPAASATTLVFNLVAITGGLYRYGREGLLYWPLALVIATGGAPGTLAATFITSAFALLAYGGLPAPPGVSTGPDWLLGLAFGGGGLGVDTCLTRRE